MESEEQPGASAIRWFGVRRHDWATQTCAKKRLRTQHSCFQCPSRPQRFHRQLSLTLCFTVSFPCPLCQPSFRLTLPLPLPLSPGDGSALVIPGRGLRCSYTGRSRRQESPELV